MAKKYANSVDYLIASIKQNIEDGIIDARIYRHQIRMLIIFSKYKG